MECVFSFVHESLEKRPTVSGQMKSGLIYNTVFSYYWYL